MPKDPGEMRKGKSKNKTANVKTIPAKKEMEDPKIKVTDKDWIKVFKCDLCGVQFKLYDLGKVAPDKEA